jgi:type I restriction enzyme S subunit
MSLPRYPKYKDSGVEWLGEVPEHWTVRPVKLIAGIVNGYPFDSKLFSSTEGYPLIRIRDLNHLEPEAYYAGEFVDAAAITSEDVLIGMDGDFNVGRWRGTGPALLNQRMCCVRGNTGIVTRLLEYALPIPLKALNDVTYATTVKHLASSQVEKTQVAMPLDESEQEEIAYFLDREVGKIDALVEEQRRLIELLKEKRQAVISHAVTKGLNRDAPMKDSGIEWLSEVPAHWDVLRLGALFEEVNEEGNDELPILSVSIHDGVSDRQLGDDEMERKVTRSEDTSKYKMVTPSDLVYNMMRAWQGGFGTVMVPGLVSPAYVVARPIRTFSSGFVEQVLRTSCAVEEMRRHSRGVTDFRLRLYWDEFKAIQIAMPPQTEQDEIMARIDGCTTEFDALAAEATHAIDLLQERRTALISAAVTGKIDVRGLAIEEAA